MTEPRPLILSLQYPSPRRAFSGIFIHRHVRALIEAGLHLQLVSPRPWLPRPLRVRERWRHLLATGAEQEYEGVKVLHPAYVHLPGPVVRHATFVALGLRLAAYAKAALGAQDLNLIHAHRVYPEGIAGLVAARRLGLPLVCSARGSDVHSLPHASRAHMWIARSVLRRSDAVTAVSRDLATKAEEIAGRDRGIRVIYNGVEARTFSPCQSKDAERQRLGLPLTGRLLLFVGRFETAKGARELTVAFRALQAERTQAHLVVVGPKLYADGCDQPGGMHFVGEVVPREVAGYMRACDVFAFPSHAEGMPNALLEAMSCGLPPVATPVGGIPEVISDGENGYIVPVGDTTALADRLRRLIVDPGLAAGMGAKAAATIGARFSWETNAHEHLALYREVLARREAKP